MAKYPRLTWKYKLSEVNYAPTPWGLVSQLSNCKSPRMPDVYPRLGGGVGVSSDKCIGMYQAKDCDSNK